MICPFVIYIGAICPHTLTPWICSATDRPCFESRCPYMLSEWGAWRAVVQFFAPESEWFPYLHLGSGNAYGRVMLGATGWTT